MLCLTLRQVFTRHRIVCRDACSSWCQRADTVSLDWTSLRDIMLLLRNGHLSSGFRGFLGSCRVLQDFRLSTGHISCACLRCVCCTLQQGMQQQDCCTYGAAAASAADGCCCKIAVL
jgi:hypothetical protein